MLACIPAKGDAGLDDSVHDHFGSAPYFTLYDTDTGEVKVVANRNAHHDHGTCHPMNQLVRFRIDCVVCAGMGRRAIEALGSEGIKVYQGEAETIGDLIEDLKAGKLAEIDPAKACRGHGQRAGLVHGSELSGQGRGAGYGRGGPSGGGRGGAMGGSGGGRHAGTGQQRRRQRNN